MTIDQMIVCYEIMTINYSYKKKIALPHLSCLETKLIGSLGHNRTMNPLVMEKFNDLQTRPNWELNKNFQPGIVDLASIYPQEPCNTIQN